MPPLSSASLFLSFRIVVLSNCVNKCSLESKSDRHVITRFPSTQKSSASRQIVKKTADLNLRSFSLLIMSTSSGADGLLRAWWHTDCVRTSFESLWNRVQAQNSTLCLQLSSQNILLHPRHLQGKSLLILKGTSHQASQS